MSTANADGVFVRFKSTQGPRKIATESPCEALLLAAIINNFVADCFYEETHQDNGEWGFNLYGVCRSDCPEFLLPQYEIGPYRVDFAICCSDGEGPQVAIEVDGHDFHERTKEQAERDKKRDRYLQHHGWNVLRFTGSEVFGDANKCAREVLSFREKP